MKPCGAASSHSLCCVTSYSLPAPWPIRRGATGSIVVPPIVATMCVGTWAIVASARIISFVKQASPDWP
jgi:hypothetical protein